MKGYLSVTDANVLQQGLANGQFFNEFRLPKTDVQDKSATDYEVTSYYCTK